MRLLAEHELTVAELVAVTRLPQPRVSTHLRRLRDAGLVEDRRNGGSSFYSLSGSGWSHAAAVAWREVLSRTADPVLSEDADRLLQVLDARTSEHGWVDSVAGDMARHYSPGRTWESLIRGLVGLLDLGHVVDLASGDGAVAELLAPRARRVTCVDANARAVEAGQRRLGELPHVRFVQGDMHEVPVASGDADQVLLLQALPYARDPLRVLTEVSRILRPGGRVACVALRAHIHADAVARYDHVNLGIEPDALAALATSVGLEVTHCAPGSRERRPPHFETVVLHARKPPLVAGAAG